MRLTMAAMLLATMVTTAAAARGDQQLGKGVSVAEATPIAALYKTPAQYAGKTIRVDGFVTAVCEEMGCWMALAETERGERTVRFKVEHEGSLVFPVSATGKRASAQGVFVKIAADDRDANDAAREQAADAFGKTYQINVTGAVVR
jgi:hypothetical protein